MANPDHLRLLRTSVDAWNRWRRKMPEDSTVDLNGADLSRLSLVGINLSRASLCGADLSECKLTAADLSHSDLRCANLTDAYLERVNFKAAILDHANLGSSFWHEAILTDASLAQTNFSGSYFGGNKLVRVNFAQAGNLDLAQALYPCAFDYGFLGTAYLLPYTFLRSIGLTDLFIDYLPSFFGQPISYFSCFISYSSKDAVFADRLFGDLRARNVRCWYSPDSLPIGEKILDSVVTQIRLRDKVLLVLSEHSLRSHYVEYEVIAALEEERHRNKTIIFPVRVDDAVMDSSVPWATQLRARRIGDFTRWKEGNLYKAELERLLRDLNASPQGT